MYRILLPILDLLRPNSPVSVIPRGLGESLLSEPVTMPVYRVARTHQASFFDRARRKSATLHPSTRRLDGYGRASESFEVQAHGR